MLEFSQIKKLLFQLPGIELGVPATTAEIVRLEEALCVSLASEYIEFLRGIGSCSWDGDAVFGVFKPEYPFGANVGSYDLDVVRQTIAFRRRFVDGPAAQVLQSGIVVGDDGGGGPKVLVSNGNPTFGKVCYYSFFDADEPIAEWDSFVHYLHERVQLGLRRKREI